MVLLLSFLSSNVFTQADEVIVVGSQIQGSGQLYWVMANSDKS